jgi:hypothetical protein
MNQNNMSNSQKSSQSGLKPALAAALASLEVPIEQELARYRRTRMGIKMQNQSHLGSYLSSQSLDLPTYQPREEKVTESPDTEGLLLVNESATGHPAPTNDNLDDSLLLSDSESIKTQIPESPTNSVSSIVPARLEQQNLTPTNADSSSPDDYLESSEALLRSLTDEEQPTTPPSNSHDHLLSPVGIGSMLLLLLASLTLGYVVLNPNSPGSSFNLARFFSRESSPMNGANTTEVTDNTVVREQTEIRPIAKSPNLAAKEFPEVRTPSDVVGLQPQPRPTPTPVFTPPPVITPNVELLPQQLESVVPADVTPTPPTAEAAEETTTPVNSNAELKPSADGFYYVVMDNQGDGALSDAQKVVPDAYLSPEGTVIYLAALKTPEAAQERVKQLQSQGLKARVLQP